MTLLISKFSQLSRKLLHFRDPCQNIFLIIFVFQTPVVENGNGLAAEHSGKSEEVAAATESAAKRPLAETEPEEAGSEAKRICSNTSEAEETQAEIVAEAPNGVNSTPHPITSGGD